MNDPVAEAVERLEKVLQAGWVWEAGNYPSDHPLGKYWAQALRRDRKGGSTGIIESGDSLAEALNSLRRKVLE